MQRPWPLWKKQGEGCWQGQEADGPGPGAALGEPQGKPVTETSPGEWGLH